MSIHLKKGVIALIGNKFFILSYKLKGVSLDNIRSTKQPYLLQDTFLDQLYIPIGSIGSSKETINKLISLINSHVLFVKDGNKFYEVISCPYCGFIQNGVFLHLQKPLIGL